jgi:hypothetical protein
MCYAPGRSNFNMTTLHHRDSDIQKSVMGHKSFLIQGLPVWLRLASDSQSFCSSIPRAGVQAGAAIYGP